MKTINKFFIFCFVGITSALVHFIFFNSFFFIFKKFIKLDSLIFGASINYIVATIIGTVISIIYNFSMNRNITFSAKQSSVRKQIPKYFTIYSLSISFSFIVNLIVINILGSETVINANIATICGIISGIPISFFGSLLWTFKEKNY